MFYKIVLQVRDASTYERKCFDARVGAAVGETVWFAVGDDLDAVKSILITSDDGSKIEDLDAQNDLAFDCAFNILDGEYNEDQLSKILSLFTW